MLSESRFFKGGKSKPGPDFDRTLLALGLLGPVFAWFAPAGILQPYVAVAQARASGSPSIASLTDDLKAGDLDFQQDHGLRPEVSSGNHGAGCLENL